MKECPYCQNLNDEKNTECAFCGEAFPEEDEKAAPVKSPEAKQKKRSTVLVTIIWGLVAAILITTVILGIRLIGFLNNGKSEDDTAANAPELTVPTLEVLYDKTGVAYLHAVFSGTAGDGLYLGCSGASYAFESDTLTLDLYLPDLFDADYTFSSDSVSVNLSAFYRNSDGRFPYSIEPVSMPVPATGLQILSPEGGKAKVYQTNYTMRLWADPSASVTVNGINLSSQMTSDGSLNYGIELAPGSSNTFSFAASAPYHYPSTCTVVLSRPSMPVNVEITSKYDTVVSSDTVQIEGVADVGAIFKCSLPTKGKVTQFRPYGQFQMTMDLSGQKFGHYEVPISVTTANGTSTIAYSFWYWPEEKKYTTTCSAVTEAMLTSSSCKGQKFLLSGFTAEEIVSGSRVRGTISFEGKDYTVLLNYSYLNKPLTEGKTYRVFADSAGLEDGLPVLNLRFIYPK